MHPKKNTQDENQLWMLKKKRWFPTYSRKVSNVALAKQGLISRGLPKPADLQEEWKGGDSKTLHT